MISDKICFNGNACVNLRCRFKHKQNGKILSEEKDYKMRLDNCKKIGKNYECHTNLYCRGKYKEVGNLCKRTEYCSFKHTFDNGEILLPRYMETIQDYNLKLHEDREYNNTSHEVHKAMYECCLPKKQTRKKQVGKKQVGKKQVGKKQVGKIQTEKKKQTIPLNSKSEFPPPPKKWVDISTNKSESTTFVDTELTKLTDERNKLEEEKQKFLIERNKLEEEKKKFLIERNKLEEEKKKFLIERNKFDEDKQNNKLRISKFEEEKKKFLIDKKKFDEDKQNNEKKQNNEDNKSDSADTEDEIIKKKEEELDQREISIIIEENRLSKLQYSIDETINRFCWQKDINLKQLNDICIMISSQYDTVTRYENIEDEFLSCVTGDSITEGKNNIKQLVDMLRTYRIKNLE